MAAPNFFVLGAAKCGTTTLHELLGAHPRVFVTREKEPRFFDDDVYYAMGVERYLRDHFRGAASYPARGEATPSYLSAGSKARDRMLRDLGNDLRFLVILRDPVERAWSHYLHQVRYHAETESFERALELEPARRREGRKAWIGYFEDGLYARQLRVWLERFPRERFLLLLTEELAADPGAVARRALAFLEVDPDAALPPRAAANVGGRARLRWLGTALNRPGTAMNVLKHLVPYPARQRLRNALNQWNRRAFDEPPELPPETARALRARYREDVVELEELLGRDLGRWREER